MDWKWLVIVWLVVFWIGLYMPDRSDGRHG